jgi:Phosphotransferase enzyme family
MEERLLDKATRVLGWRPSQWREVIGGYTPTRRFVVRDASHRAFMKVATTPVTIDMLRRELMAYSNISGLFMPEFLGGLDEDEEPLLCIEDLSAARWPPPWDARSIEAVLQAIHTMHETAAVKVLAYAQVRAKHSGAWAAIAGDPLPFLSLGFCDAVWLDAVLPELIAAEAACSTDGEALCHFDLRSDNLCLMGHRALLLDWPEACLSNPHLDLGFMLPSLAEEGGPLPETILPDAPEVAAWVAGFFAARAGLPPIPGAPGIRPVQLRQLSTALPWAIRELGLATPTGP